ncbi:MAG TPA: pentapeptide repeat-containing protein [Galbitalea sp.]
MAKHNSSPAPRINLVAPSGLTGADVQTLEPHESREGEHFDGGDLTEVDLSGISLLECLVDGVTLTDTGLRGARFVDSLISSPFATSLVAARSTWRRVRIENARWGSAELFDSVFESVIISGGKIDFLNLRGAKLTDVLIENAQITELDLASFVGTRVALRNCRIDTIDFTHATCLDVDLRETSFARVLGIQGMRGAILDEVQLAEFAPVMAGLLGIRIE